MSDKKSMNPSRIWALTFLAFALLLTLAEADSGSTGLWSFRCELQEGSEDLVFLKEFSMVLYQEGSDLFGACTSEVPEPWNGIVMGGLEGDDLRLDIMISFHPLMMARMSGQFVDENTVEGSFVCSDEMGRAVQGTFSGWLTNPDTSLYEPAVIEDSQTQVQPTVSGSPAGAEGGIKALQNVGAFQEVELIETNPFEEEKDTTTTIYRIDYSRDTVYPRPVL